MFNTTSFLDLLPSIMTSSFILILTFSLYVSFRYGPDQFIKTRLNTFFSTLAGIAIIIVGVNIVLTSLAFVYDQNFTRINKTKESVDKLWLYPNQLLNNSSHARPEFLASFFMNNIPLYELVLLPNKKSPLTSQGIIEEQFISNVMIQSWEDCLTTRKFDTTPLFLWLTSYLIWAQNPYFKSYYDIIKLSYKETTIQLADLLFEYAKKIPVPTKDNTVYQKTVKELMSDPRYTALLKKLS